MSTRPRRREPVEHREAEEPEEVVEERYDERSGEEKILLRKGTGTVAV
jgi:hypothetical protein